MNRALVTSLTLCLISAAVRGQGIAPADQAPVVVTLEEAIHRAQQNEPTFAGARGDQQSAAIDRYLAKSALLPSVVYHNQVLYTQPNGQKNQAGQTGNQPAPIFIANNAVREYASQASINETVGLKQFADLRAHPPPPREQLQSLKSPAAGSLQPSSAFITRCRTPTESRLCSLKP